MDEPTTHEHAGDDAAARRGELALRAREAADATWGETSSTRARVPGVLSGELGPKGTVSAQLRELSRSERERHGDVPRGAIAPGSGRMLLLTMIGLAIALAVTAILIGRLLS